MKTIAFVNKKGGSGKSTALVALSLYWAIRAEKKVGVLDMEVEGLSGGFVDLADHPNLTQYQDGETYDYLLIDTEGNIQDDELAEVKANADMLIIPMKPSPADVAKVMQTVDLLSNGGGGLPQNTRLLLSQVRVSTNAWKHREHYMDGLPVKSLKAYIRERTAYVNMLVSGWSALDAIAREELESLAWELS